MFFFFFFTRSFFFFHWRLQVLFNFHADGLKIYHKIHSFGFNEIGFFCFLFGISFLFCIFLIFVVHKANENAKYAKKYWVVIVFFFFFTWSLFQWRLRVLFNFHANGLQKNHKINSFGFQIFFVSMRIKKISTFLHRKFRCWPEIRGEVRIQFLSFFIRYLILFFFLIFVVLKASKNAKYATKYRFLPNVVFFFYDYFCTL